MSDDLNKKLTKIIPLGGIEEIGKNMTIIEHDDEIFIVDCGIKFADENVLFGVNAIICPFDYLIANEHKIVGLFVTHAHEDHIGGIPYLLKSINIPKIYGFKLTTLIIAKKLREHKDLKTYEFEVIDDNSEIKTKHFKINFYRVCHSIPDCFGLFIETPNGKVVHTGDFRFDLLAQGDETDILKIAEIGRKDIDLLLCETTNSETRGFSSSEKNVVDELRRIISKAKGRVFLTTFASQLSRIEEVIEIAISNNRKIALCGRSLETNIEMAIKANYLNISKNSFIEPREVKNEKPNEVIILLTGSQGEEMAALSQIAVGKHPWIAIQQDDMVIFSSSPIPGNFLNVENLMNKLYKSGAEVIVNTQKQKIHASGHATETEQQLLIKLINPHYIIPIHGEYTMLKNLRKNCLGIGLTSDDFIQISNGQIVELDNGKVKATDDFVDMYDVFVDGNTINQDSTNLLKYRQILSQDGILNATVLIDRRSKKIIDLPIISIRGSFYAKSTPPLVAKIVYSIKKNIEEAMQKISRPIENNEIKGIVEKTTDFFIWKNKKKRPLVRTAIFDI